MKKFSATVGAILILSLLNMSTEGGSSMNDYSSSASLPVSAPITTASAGQQGEIASQSVMRIVCKSTNMGGTGFLHKSGRIISAAHVVAGCPQADLVIVTPSRKILTVKSLSTDLHLDLALITPSETLSGPALLISQKTEIAVGTPVTTWGFPAGYNGLMPLLTVGYLSGVDRLQTPNGSSPARWVINAAFNGGNSGGPVLSQEDGSIIGVVSSKLAPIPSYIESALDALANQKSGFVYTRTLASGKTENISEGQVVAEVLTYLRSQTQLVLGHAVTSQDLKAFLKKEDVEP
jgi:S1-C subfamily serine protease